MSEWIAVLWITSVGLAFLWGRWSGIQTFDREMVEAGLLPPREEGND